MSSKGGINRGLIGCVLMSAGGLVVLCMGLLWLAYSFNGARELPKALTGAIRAGEKAPDFTLVSNTGDEHQLSSYAGKVVLLNFWTTWCEPCEVEMPEIELLYARYTRDDVIILGVNTRARASEVIAYGKKHHLTFPLLIDRDGEVSDLYHVRAFPTSIVIDRQGIIHRINIGSMDEDQFIEMLAEAVAGPSGGD